MLIKVLRRAAIGFALGMLVTLVLMTVGGGGKLRFSEVLLLRAGGETQAILQSLILSGLFGVISMGGTVFYEIERWPLTLATFVHYLTIIVSFNALSFYLGWAEKPVDMLVMTGIQTVGFFIIWLIMYLLYKAQVRELNDLLEKQENDRKSGEASDNTEQS